MNVHLTGLMGLLIMSSIKVQLTYGIETSLKLQDEYWGPGEYSNKTDARIRPFKIVFDKQMIDDLKMRLNHTGTPQPPLKNVGWSYGTNSRFIPTVVDYWLKKYDFQKREEHLNQYPQFLTNIQGLDIHFLHVKPEVNNDSKVEVLPLYIQNGWTSSFVEFLKIIPMLTTVRSDRDFVFEVIAPALPGFGYSDASTKPGLGPVEMAHVMKNLMLRIGFTKWYSHGGDWGAVITSFMATLYPEHVLGMHSNWCLVFNPLSLAKEALRQLPSLALNWQRTWSLFTKLISIFEEIGFFFIQGTKPDTIGVGFSDSPVGLASYILEKYAASARKEPYGYGNERLLLETFTMDDLLDNIMLYWAPKKTTSAMRLHAEVLSARNFKNRTIYETVKVPSACVQFPIELFNLPETLLRERFLNLVSFTKMPRGGHYAALEEPQLLADDIWAAVQKMREYDRKTKCPWIKRLFSTCV